MNTQHYRPLTEAKFAADFPEWQEDRWLINTIRALKFALSAAVGMGGFVALVVWAVEGVVR